MHRISLYGFFFFFFFLAYPWYHHIAHIFLQLNFFYSLNSISWTSIYISEYQKIYVSIFHFEWYFHSMAVSNLCTQCSIGGYAGHSHFSIKQAMLQCTFLSVPLCAPVRVFL